MAMVLFGIVLMALTSRGVCDNWFKGCYNDSLAGILRDGSNFSHVDTVAECASLCDVQGFTYSGVQWAEGGDSKIPDAFSCACLNVSTESIETCSQQFSSSGELPVSSSSDIWAVYDSEGPYLTSVTIATDSRVAIVDTPISIEIQITRATAANVTQDDVELGHTVDVRWSIEKDSSSYSVNLTMRNFTQILHRPKHVFTKPGNYTLDVEVSNGISSKHASLDLEIVFPAPRDLQIAISDDLDLPSCIPDKFKVTDTTGQVFAVFVNTLFQLEAAVSMGTNMTFTFWFEDTNEIRVFESCRNCTMIKTEYVFKEMGTYDIFTSVENVYGRLEKYVTVVVIERQLTSLTFDLDPKSLNPATIGQPVFFTVSMVTTSRSNRYLQIWYGDGTSNTVSLEDTKSPRLVLEGDGKEVDIVASYGEGCRLLVEFQYNYVMEGLFQPKVSVFDKYSETEQKSEEDKKSDVDVFESHKIGSKKFSENQKYFEKIQNNHSPYELPLERYFGLFENSLSSKNSDSSLLDESDKNVKVEAKLVESSLPVSILVLSEIRGMKLHTYPVGKCNEPMEIQLQISTFVNISLQWFVFKIIDLDEGDIGNYDAEIMNQDTDLKLVFELNSTDTRLVHTFGQVGAYLITAKASNAVSFATASINIIIQCPVGKLYAECSDEFIETGSEVTCRARVSRGSSVAFYWSIEGFQTKTYVQYKNFTSLIKHKFRKPGVYDISVGAMNNISRSNLFEIDPVHVMDPIKEIRVFKNTHNLLGNFTQVQAMHYPKNKDLYVDDIKFEFDFGIGRGNFPCDKHLCWQQCRMIAERQLCMGQAGYQFKTLGAHEITVYASNKVSEVEKTVVVHVYDGLDKVTVTVLNKPIAGSPTRFMVLKKGKTMETSDVYFTWKFLKDAGVYYTTAPIAETVFNSPGSYTVLVNITNPVDLKNLSIPVYVRSRTEDDLELIHDLYVTPQTQVTFELKGSLTGWDKIHVSYTDGNSEIYNVPAYNTFRFSHMFHEAGVQHVNVTLVGTRQTTIETLTTYLVVQEPVTGLKLTGPTTLAYQEYDSGTWTASIETGTDVLYRWTLGETYLVTTPEFEMQIPPSGNYEVHVEAYNDVTDPPLKAFLPVLVQNVIYHIDVDIHGNLVGKPSKVKVTVSGSKQQYKNFIISVDYGDEESETYEYVLDLIAMEMEMEDIDLDLDPFDFFHVYETPGEYNITVNVSNNVSSVVAMEIFAPIEDIHITARSPQVIRTPGHVVVKAMVTGGNDLTYAWNFMDTFEETLVTSYPNQTSIAKHPYGLSGNYCVTFTVTGHNYPSPGISVKLPDCFLVVDPIDTVKLFASQNSSALEGNKTTPIVFTVRSSGSHVVFVFDFGDGTIKKQHGTLLSHMTVDMTMFAEVTHIYTAVGQYKVRVTASNPLGNHSVDLASLFWVQVPPTDLRFCEAMKNNSMFTGYSGKVGETVTMCVDVAAGTNVTFDWKLGDQTDLVQQGRIVSHKYLSPGDKTVYVVARNRVHFISRSIQVHINYEIQGVELIPQHTTVAAGQEILFTAVVRPDHPNITTHYLWSFRSPTRSSIRGSSGGRGSSWDPPLLPSKQNPVPHTFLVPGQSSATVTAVNHISRMSSASVDIYVYEKIEFSEISILGDKTMRLVNKPIRFKYYAYRGTDVNLTWSFDDGTDSVFTLMSEVEHTFTREGAYNITLLVKNPVSSQTVRKMVFILHKSYCNKPKVTLSSESGLKIVYSRQFTIEADVEPDCNLTSVMAYRWSVDGHVTQLLLETKNKVLVLPPKSLKYGNHTIELQVDMIGTIVSVKESTTVEVVPSGLVSMIQGGVFQRLRGGDIFVMDGSDSYDPDEMDNEKLKYEWKCSYVTDDGNYGNTCFHDKTTLTTSTHNVTCPSVAMDTSVLRLHSDCLVAASNYTFDLTVYAEGRRNGTSYQTISFEKEAADVLNIRIVQPFSKVGPVNAGRKVSFYVDCSNCRQNGTLYQWRIKYLTGYNVHNYARAHDYPCVEADGKTYQALKVNLTATGSDSDAKPALAGNQSVITDPETISTKSVPEMSTETPLLPFEGLIVEGKPSEVKNRRRNRQMPADEEKEEEHLNSFPKVTENADNTRRTKTSPLGLDIGENINSGRGRVVQRFPLPQIEEGTPGESGSSGGRQYVFEDKVEDRYGSVDPYDQNKEVTEGSGSSLDNLDKVVGEPNRKPLELDLPMVLNYLPAEKTRTGLDGATLVIKPGFLRQGLTYFVEVKVIDEERGLQGEAISSFVVNESPVFGKCSIKPEVGVEMETEFSILCKEWKDDHQPLMYEVSFSRDQSEERILVYRGVNNRLMFKLPAGKPDRQFKVNVYIDILDALLAKTSVCSLAIEVTPKTVSDGFGGERNLASSSRLIYGEITDNDGDLRKSVAAGKDSLSKVYITYLGTWLNSLHDSANSTSSSAAYLIENSNATYIHETIVDWEEEEEYSRAARTELLRILHELPVRDEAEVLQSARALAVTTALYEQLDLSALDLALKILKSVCSGALSVYKNDIVPDENVLQLAVSTMSSVVMGTMGIVDGGDRMLQYLYKQMIQEALDCIERLVLNELKFHVAREEPIESSTKHLAILAARHPAAWIQSLSIGKTRFKLPSMLGNIGDNINAGNRPTNQACMQSHMTTFKMNPYGMQDRNKVHSVVGGLNLYDCQGRLLYVDNLKEQDRIQIDLPNLHPKAVVFKNITLQKWSMNIHQFNVSSSDLDHALHFLVEFVPVSKGRLFPVTVLLSVSKPPSPEYYKLRYDFEPGENTVDIFLPAGTLNGTGMYYIGILDSTYNKGRPRQGEVTERNYTLKLWWGQCLYWSSSQEAWLPDGCQITQDSTLEVTKCTCNHLTSFGGRFELIPNELSIADIEGFFSLHRNPVTLTLVSVVLVLYCVALFCCYHADLHDSKKGGIVYLLDNSPMDQQKFEITVETGFWKGAGTSAKISIILHGEEGMSETRELISEDDRPMFERNSRDKFILSLPDSIGRIWKVQVWHNNFGPSPSWYLNRVIVRDLNSGSQYLFICEKWLAVEEQDGKVEREFMVQDGTLLFVKAYMAKAIEYMSDFHIWISLVTCPPYSGFMRTERLTVCLTMLMTYMCLNALWYKTTVNEYRGEFGLLDVSWRNLAVGAICCAVILPLGGLLEFLFRRSKPKHASNCQSKDEVADWEPDYPSGKPNEQESEDSSEHVQPIMTYSLLDQSILNWPNIQTWAQKQWMKRQATGRSVQDSNSGNSSNHSGHHGSNGSTGRQGINPEDILTLHTQGLSELDQASSGFEDCSSLIRPKASVDSTHTTAAPSVNESTIVHKPQSLPDSLRISTKLTSDSDYEKTSKAPSVSSSGSHKSSVLHERKKSRVLQHLYLPYWCRYLAWGLCAVICVGCATVTIMYGYRFGITKSTLWLQSLYFSIMISVFVANPLLILMVVCYAAWVYKNNPTSLDHYSYDIFNREKAKQDLIRWKKQLESWDEGEALERGVAARQRSRYLRFARPPQEKQLIEARKRVLKEKKALTMFRESVAFAVSIILLLIMAYSKSGIPAYRLNLAVRTTFLRPGSEEFSKIDTREDWYRWAQTTLLDAASKYSKLHSKNKNDSSFTSTYMIGQIQLRQQRILEVPCHDKLPHLHGGCLSNSVTMDTRTFGNVLGLSYTNGFYGDFMFGKHGVYDGTGFILSLNNTRKEGYMQLKSLQEHGWLDRQTRALFVELTLYNPPTNLFTAVRLLAEMSSTGSVSTSVKVTSTQLFRYVTVWDGILLNSELLFFILMMLLVKSQTLQILAEKHNYFYSLWNIINFLLAVISVVYCGCFVYRFVIVADIVENLRSTYYEKYISVAFITFWDEVLRSAVGILLFLSCVKCLRLLRFNKQFAVFGEVYRRARREIIIFLAVFCVILAAYTSLGHMLFGSMVMTFRDLWSSVMGVTAVLAGSYVLPEFHSQGQTTAARLYIFSASVFGTGFLTAYMIAVLSHYFKSRKRRRQLAMGFKETILFYWQQLEFWTGLKKPRIEEEPVVILPPEFTMAEIEYQVDELLFRMNALTGSHGLPEKPPCYLTDSDCTYGAGDDGISSAGSEAGMNYIEDRLEQRVQKIEDNLCSQEPFLAQLLKFDSIGAKDLTQEREKQLRSHLELEIFRQLQIQRQDFKTPAEESTNKGDNSDQPAADEKTGKTAPHSPGQVSTSSDEMGQKTAPPPKPSKPRRTRSSLKVQTLEDLLAKTTHEFMDCHDNSSSNPDSPRDKLAFAKLLKAGDGARKFPCKQHSSSSSSEKISPDLSHSHVNSSEMETIKKPTKPTFLHSREASLSDAPKGSPNLKLRTSGLDKGGKSELNPTGLPESSSGSEQDSLQLGKKLFGRRSLRKTRSRGKGKGPDSLEPALILDEVEWEEAESFKVEVDKVVESTGEVVPLLDKDCVIQEVTSDRPDVQEYVVTADVHHSQS